MSEKKPPKMADLHPKTGELVEMFQQLLRLHHWAIKWTEADVKLPGCYATVIYEESRHPERTNQEAFIIFEKGAAERPETVGHEMVHIFLANLGVCDLSEDIEEALVRRILEILLAQLKERGVIK